MPTARLPGSTITGTELESRVLKHFRHYPGEVVGVTELRDAMGLLQNRSMRGRVSHTCAALAKRPAHGKYQLVGG